jgi:hypothetical protein
MGRGYRNGGDVDRGRRCMASATSARDAFARAQIEPDEAAISAARGICTPHVAFPAQPLAMFAAAGNAFRVRVEGLEDFFRRRSLDIDGRLALVLRWGLFVVEFAGVDRVVGF